MPHQHCYNCLPVAVMSAVVLSVSACASESAADGVEPSCRPAVKTQIVINVPRALTNGDTRMAEATVQAQAVPVFRGMEHIHIIPFATEGRIEASHPRLSTHIALGSLTAGTPATGPDLHDGNGSKVYADIGVPLGTASFLFYGRAPTGSMPKAATGSLVAEGLETDGHAGTISFAPERIYGSTDVPDEATQMVALLNSVADATTTGSYYYRTGGGYGGYTYHLISPLLRWSDVESSGNQALHAARQMLTGGGLRNASGADVARLLKQVYDHLASTVTGNQTYRHGGYDVYYRSGYGYATATQARVYNDLRTAIRTAVAQHVDTSSPATLRQASLQGYPASLGLPDGVHGMLWNGTSFELFTEGAVGTLELIPMQDYVYPAELWYYANSLINTDNASQADVYDSATDWAAVLAAYANRPGVVTSGTRSVAMQEKVNYGVGRLDVSIGLGTSDGTISDSEKTFALGAASTAMPLTGLVIGCQRAVGHDFWPSGAMRFSAYDGNPVQGIYLRSVRSAHTHTLVLPTADDDKVALVIEMQNDYASDTSIRASQYTIPHGARFYLRCALQTDDGQPVFRKDCVTKADITINSLKQATPVVAGDTSPMLEVDIDVRLEWVQVQTTNVILE